MKITAKSEVVDRNGKTWNKDDLQFSLQENDRFLLRSLVVIFERQTTDEQRARETRYQNSVGFTATDGRKLTKFAQLAKGKHKLLSHEMYEIRRRMPKYWNQLMHEIHIVAQAQAQKA